MEGQVIGLIPKNFLLVLVARKQFYSDKNQKYFVLNGNLKKYLEENLGRHLTDDDGMSSNYGSSNALGDKPEDFTSINKSKKDVQSQLNQRGDELLGSPLKK